MWGDAGWMVLIAGLGAYIAYQQFRVNREKLRLEMFERRLQVFDQVRDTLRRVIETGAASHADVMNIVEAKGRARFLFGDDVAASLQQIREILNCLLASQNNLDVMSPAALHFDVCREDVESQHRSDLLWLEARHDTLSSDFAPYLQFSGFRSHSPMIRALWRHICSWPWFIRSRIAAIIARLKRGLSR